MFKYIIRNEVKETQKQLRQVPGIIIITFALFERVKFTPETIETLNSVSAQKNEMLQSISVKRNLFFLLANFGRLSHFDKKNSNKHSH